MKAKQNTKCNYPQCTHGGMIYPGQEMTWNRKAMGQRYHVDCFTAMTGGGYVIKCSKCGGDARVPFAPKPGTEGTLLCLPCYKASKGYKATESKPVAVTFPVVEDIVLEDEIIIEETVIDDGELRHFLYPVLKHYVAIRQHVYLWSAPGSGKSHVARQIAAEFELQFRYVSVNPQSPVSLLLGYMDANGIYRESGLFACWRDGGVFLFDELDNCSSSVLTILNGMLASNEGEFPCGMVPRHKDFVFIGTGNTTGRGGDWQYPERRKIDEASLDRLSFVRWDYDLKLELNLALGCNPKATQWVEWVQAVRKFASNKANGIKGGVYATPRSSMAGAKDLVLLRSGVTVAELAERHCFKGLDSDTVARIIANCPLPRI